MCILIILINVAGGEISFYDLITLFSENFLAFSKLSFVIPTLFNLSSSLVPIYYIKGFVQYDILPINSFIVSIGFLKYRYPYCEVQLSYY